MCQAWSHWSFRECRVLEMKRRIKASFECLYMHVLQCMLNTNTFKDKMEKNVRQIQLILKALLLLCLLLLVGKKSVLLCKCTSTFLFSFQNCIHCCTNYCEFGLLFAKNVCCQSQENDLRWIIMYPPPQKKRELCIFSSVLLPVGIYTSL